MSTMKKFDKSNVEAVRREVMDAVKMVLAKRGIDPAYMGGRYSDEKFSLKIDLNIMAESSMGEAMPASFPKDAARVGIPINCFGREFDLRGIRYRVCGIKTRNRKYPVIATALSGPKRGYDYKLDAGSVSRALSRGTSLGGA